MIPLLLSIRTEKLHDAGNLLCRAWCERTFQPGVQPDITARQFFNLKLLREEEMLCTMEVNYGYTNMPTLMRFGRKMDICYQTAAGDATSWSIQRLPKEKDSWSHN